MRDLINHIVKGLERKAITSVSKWSEKYRIMGPPFPGPWTFNFHPWLREISDCKSEIVVGRKAAQMGFTEVALNMTFAAMDLHHHSVLYVLPASKPDAADFSSSRFDPALEASTHLSKLFTDVQNTGHKRAGYANLFIRGSRSRSQMKSLPVAKIFFDEVAEMVQEHITLAMERMSGQLERQAFLLSTPTLAGENIDKWYTLSDQREYFFKCPHCSQLINLTQENLIITSDDATNQEVNNSHLICLHCKQVLAHEDKPNFLKHGEWVPKTNSSITGYTIGQFYSCVMPPYKLAQLALSNDPADEQEYFNSKCGLPHEVKGARISNDDINACIGDFSQYLPKGLITMGVDIGKWLHYIILDWKDDRPKVARIGKCTHFEEIDQIILNNNVLYTVLDTEPESRKALELCNRFYGAAKRCRYVMGLQGRQLKENEEHSISVDRTSWLDVTFGRFRKRDLLLPKDITPEYREHIMSNARIYLKDKDGNPVGRYQNKGGDHLAHAQNYAEIAYELLKKVSGQKTVNIRSPL